MCVMKTPKVETPPPAPTIDVSIPLRKFRKDIPFGLPYFDANGFHPSKEV